MSSFVKCVIPPTCKPPDPDKHVFYSHGMVLGEDDFVQEYAYLSGRDQWLARDLLGYGTVCGLEVFADPLNASGPQVVVTSGVALSPQGKLIRVDPAQCALLNAWLADHKNDKQAVLTSDPSGTQSLTLYLTLAYDPCPTDSLPVPGEPCRTESETMAPSRIKDGFLLDLAWQPPAQIEEKALRDFVFWLRGVKINNVDPPTSLADFEKAVRDAAHLLFPPSSPPLSPPSSPPDSFPDFMFGTPASNLVIPTAQSGAYLRSAFRIWTTELRPTWVEAGQTPGRPPAVKEVLLAQIGMAINVGLSGAWTVNTALPITIVEDTRPYLVHLRMLQEWLLAGLAGNNEEILDGEVKGPFLDNKVDRLMGILVGPRPKPAFSPAPKPGEVLTIVQGLHGIHWDHQAVNVPASSNALPASIVLGAAGNAGANANYSRSDHAHGSTAPGGDVTPNADNTPNKLSVVGLQEFPLKKPDVVANKPGSLLSFQTDHWELVPPISASSGPNPSSIAPQAVAVGGAAAVGGSLDYSRADHVHAAPAYPVVPAASNAVPQPVAAGGAGAAGNANDFSRSNHIHAAPAVPVVPAASNAAPQPVAAGGSGAPGASPNYSRADHVHAAPGASNSAVAAGQFDGQGNTIFSTGGLSAKFLTNGVYLLSFNAYKPTINYVVKGTPVVSLAMKVPHVFEVLLADSPLKDFLAQFGLGPDQGIYVRILQANTEPTPCNFMVEISAY